MSHVILNGASVNLPGGKTTEVKLSIVNLPTTRPIETMIQTGQTHTLVSGIVVQNGLTTPEVSYRRFLKPAIGRRLRFCVIVATGRRKHTQVELLWITWRIRIIFAFPINSERLDASVFTSMLPEIGRKIRTCATRATDVISERMHCSRRRRHTQVEITSPHKQLGNSKAITRIY